MRNSACKDTIREELRKIYDRAGDDPPNIDQACVLIKRQIPASRSRVREVLKEDEFARRRRGPGRKAKRSPKPAVAQRVQTADRAGDGA